jgi:hypothetical protein
LCDVRFTLESRHRLSTLGCPLWAKSCREQVQQKLRLFDHLVRQGEHVRRNIDAQRFGSLEIQHQLELG